MQSVKMRGGKYMIDVDVDLTGERMIFSFPFNNYLKDEIKAMAGARWDPETKTWSAVKNARNLYRLGFLMGNKIYADYDKPLLDLDLDPRKCYRCGKGKPNPNCSLCHGSGLIRHFLHQLEGYRFVNTRKKCILAYGMGLGKTLIAIETIDYQAKVNGLEKCFYVGPRSALAAVQLEWERWQPKIRPRFMTYEELKKIVEGCDIPEMIFFDEASRIKTPTSQRGQAAKLIADDVRGTHQEMGLIVELTGTPAPKSPLDWYWLTEVCRPGFLKEGTYEKFKYNLAIIKSEESPTGGTYPKLVCWRDDEKKCNECGQPQNAMHHQVYGVLDFHYFVPSVNEVARLYKRMKGLVLIKKPEDALDLPELRYEIIRIKPSQEVLNAAELIKGKSARAIQAMTLLRELSDGFQYTEKEEGTRDCPLCRGTGSISSQLAPVDVQREVLCPFCGSSIADGEAICVNCDNYVGDLNTYIEQESDYDPAKYEAALIPVGSEPTVRECPQCKGSGQVPRIVRDTKNVVSPKDDVIKRLLGEHEEVGRIIIYAGFTGSIDKLVALVKKEKWNYIRVDGRGWESDLATKDIDMIRLFQDSDTERIAFIAHPRSGGMGLTLTASPTEVFYSNGFNGEDRHQAEYRHRRPGMDLNRGAMIYDLFHLPIDEYIYNNLKAKRRLEDISMGQMVDEVNKLEQISWR